MELELKHIVVYLNHGLNVEIKYGQEKRILTIDALFRNGIVVFHHSNERFNSNIEREIKDIKPTLRPLSDLTKEEFNHVWEHETDFLSVELIVDLGYEALLAQKFSHYFWESLYKNHIDIHGLIEQGLAIDINTLTK
tara:strand:- start:1360 stop:1770 length:411 start_codon:yes stop_codon:yes gene_type:complete